MNRQEAIHAHEIFIFVHHAHSIGMVINTYKRRKISISARVIFASNLEHELL